MGSRKADSVEDCFTTGVLTVVPGIESQAQMPGFAEVRDVKSGEVPAETEARAKSRGEEDGEEELLQAVRRNNIARRKTMFFFIFSCTSLEVHCKRSGDDIVPRENCSAPSLSLIAFRGKGMLHSILYGQMPRRWRPRLSM